MPFIVQREPQDETVLRIVTYTPGDRMDDRQKAYTRSEFLRLCGNLALTDLCLAAAFLWGMAVLSLPGLVFAFQALRGVRVCFDAMAGQGLRTDYLFFSDRLRLIECGSVAEVSYSDVASVVFFDAGLVLRFRDGTGRVIDPRAIEDAECGEDLDRLLRIKLGGRYRNKFRDKDYVARVQESDRKDASRRVERFGRQLLEVTYDVDGIDRRDYCRLVTRTGAFGKASKVLIPVLAAVATAAPVAGVLFREPRLYVVCYVTVFVIGLLLLPMYIGLSGPASRRFPAGDGQTLTAYIHADGVIAVGGGHGIAAAWNEIVDVRYDKDIGLSLDLGKQGVVYLPADMASEEMLEEIEGRARGREV